MRCELRFNSASYLILKAVLNLLFMKAIFILLFWLNIINVFPQSWERILGEPNRPEALQNINESYDKGFYVLGIKEFYPETKGYVIKTDINGYPLYELTLGVDTSQASLTHRDNK